ncbi:MAG TPA: DsbA family protein, partial [Patescibacteria group bacterium]|nr:DsbA family protein [Patescibacteria group bacterium]
MPDSKLIEFDLFYDYQCPFVYRAAVLLDAVAGTHARRLSVRWRYFSLAQVNSRREGWTIWKSAPDETVTGKLAFQAAEAARRQGRFDDLHMPLLHAHHRDGLSIDERGVVERIAGAAGLDMKRFRSDVADPTILEALARDHQEGIAQHGVFGTPTFVFPDGAAAYI